MHILILTVKHGFIIFLITQIQSGLQGEYALLNRGACRQFCSDHSLPSIAQVAKSESTVGQGYLQNGGELFIGIGHVLG